LRFVQKSRKNNSQLERFQLLFSRILQPEVQLQDRLEAQSFCEPAIVSENEVLDWRSYLCVPLHKITCAAIDWPNAVWEFVIFKFPVNKRICVMHMELD
jgi:hypothetical protein